MAVESAPPDNRGKTQMKRMKQPGPAAPGSPARIDTLDGLREHLQWAIEPDLPQAISVLEEEDGLASALWVTGGVPVLRADGRPLETRNRMTL
jgi:hypothetical protein